MIVKNDDSGEATFKQLRKYGETIVPYLLNSKHEDIELTARAKCRICGESGEEGEEVLRPVELLTSLFFSALYI